MNYDGLKLKNEIARRELSVPEFAQMAGVSRFCVYRALCSSGKVRTKTLGKIAHALGYENPTDLLLEPKVSAIEE